MKTSFITATILSATLSLSANTAYAANAAVENAIKSRSDLSSFYEALVNSGVAAELESGRSYSIFAPTNEAFSKITPTQYPCFYSVQCQAEVASVVRNHIIPGEAYVSDIARQKGGVYAINKRFVNIGDQNAPNSKGGSYSGKNQFIVDGHNVTYTSWFGGGVLYKIDGVIANPMELSMFQYAPVAVVAEERTVTTTRSPAVYPADSVTHTTVTRTAPAVLVPTYAPAR